MTKLQELRELIIKANHPNWTKDFTINAICKTCGGEGEIWCDRKEDTIDCSCDCGIVQVEKPVSLAETLIAVASNSRSQATYYPHSNGLMVWIFDDRDDNINGAQWDLTKDLDNQSKETIDQLLILIKESGGNND